MSLVLMLSRRLKRCMISKQRTQTNWSWRKETLFWWYLQSYLKTRYDLPECLTFVLLSFLVLTLIIRTWFECSLDSLFRMLVGSLASERATGSSAEAPLRKDCFLKTLRSAWSKGPQLVMRRRVDLDVCRQSHPPWSLMYWWQLSIRPGKNHIRGNKD